MSTSKRFKVDFSKLKIGMLYFLLGAGGIWHILNIFQTAMRILASPMIVGLTVWIWGESWHLFSKQEKISESKLKRGSLTRKIKFTQKQKNKFILWSLLVFIGSFGVELLGVRTGQIFGVYFYGKTLKPFLFQVPIAIGFAWLGMLISSITITQKALMEKFTQNAIKSAFFISLLMVIFDLFMEPAAVKLEYWQWVGNKIPLQNYFAWFLLSFLFSYLGLRL
nr:carotenoid biosynthesis protein [bacterium]